MKAVRRRAMKKSVIAKGKRARLSVFNGTFAKTDQGLDRGRDQGAQGARREGLRRCEEGDPPVQEGEGVLRQVSITTRPSRQRGRCCSGMWGSPTSCLSDGRPRPSVRACIGPEISCTPQIPVCAGLK